MINKLTSEDQLLEPKFREQVILEITGSENVERKLQQLKRTEMYRDQTKKYVMERLRRQKLKEETLIQMDARATNVSICKKVINKLARIYVGGVERIVPSKEDRQKVDEVARLLNLNQNMKKADRYRELHKNALVMVLPEREWEKPTYTLKAKVYAPWQFDVIEDYQDNETPRVIVFTDFVERNQMISVTEGGAGNGRDEIIADREEDKGECHRRFIWWSEKYHFTTDDKGAVIAELSPKNRLNPINMIPGVSLAEDQDGNFWAKGGDDLIEGSLLLNVMLTDMNNIMYQQGYGQLVVTGKDMKKQLDVGPTTALLLEQEHKDDPTPTAQFISASPPVDDWMKAVEQLVALILSTNNLSPSSVAGKLDASQFPSGIAMLIEQSEALGDIDDMRGFFTHAERELWRVIDSWMRLYSSNKLLAEPFKEIGQINGVDDLTLRFIDPKPAISEKEKLENLKVRKDLGLNTELELLKLDNPELTEQEAQQKLLRLKLEKAERMAQAMEQQIAQQEVTDEKVQEETKAEVDIEEEDADV